MEWRNLLQSIFRCFLILLASYYFYKKENKFMRAIFLIFILSFVPLLLYHFFAIDIDLFSTWLYYVVIFSSLYLGSTVGFYDRYKWWDRMLHMLSGIAFVGFGMAGAERGAELMKWLLLFFGFTFSITIHVFWEVLEYGCDCVFHSDAQRWQKIHSTNNHVSEKAIQPSGLVDTMNDFICCIFGAMAAVIVWGLIL